jgi:DNA-binding PadR family transcriptional regulator
MSPLRQSPLTIEHALLGFLRQSSMHGYEIYQHLSEPGRLGAVWHIKQSYLYALLTRLENEGLIAMITLQVQDFRPPRKVYALTSSGEKAFLDWVQTPVAHGRDVRLNFLVKLFFARREGAEAVTYLLERQRIACQGWLIEQEETANELDKTQAYEWLVCQFRIGQLRAMLDWLDVCEQTLAAGEAP